MVEVTLYDDEPQFAVARDGDVKLTIRAEHTTIHLSVGRIHDSASLLAQSLHHLAEASRCASCGLPGPTAACRTRCTGRTTTRT